jgi:putative transferase (TIGR04331 family)
VSPKNIKDVSRHLITVADERCWPFDRPAIFLGQWCLNYDRRHVWQAMDAIVAAPYGLGQAAKDADRAEALVLEARLSSTLCSQLNQFHGVRYSDRFWKIVCGHWLRRYVNVMLNRVRTLEQCFRENDISGTTALPRDSYLLATQDSYAAIFAFNDDRWNNALTLRILDLMDELPCPVEFVSGGGANQFRLALSPTPSTPKKKVLGWCYRQVRKLATHLVRPDDAMLINTYLPIKEETKLQLSLGGCPQFWQSPTVNTEEKPDPELRRKLAVGMVTASDSQLEKILRGLVFELLPVCYLEGFSSLDRMVRNQPWPARPKFIFTSNNFDTNEVFKLWAAKKAESGLSYVIGQHGNNYGTHRYLNETVEEIVADKFLTWGWTDGLPQHIPAFIFKTAGRAAQACNPCGGLLLIEVCLEHRLSTWDVTHEFKAYFEDQQKFILNLRAHPRSVLTVRLHGGYRAQQWQEPLRWAEFSSDLSVETGALDIRDLIRENRLVVHSYDSTGILETLSQNIPTLAFWQNDFEHLRDSARPYYQTLVDAGIVHLTAESAASKVNEIWEDVEGWWASAPIQDARKNFCGRYARTCKNAVREIKPLLLEASPDNG